MDTEVFSQLSILNNEAVVKFLPYPLSKVLNLLTSDDLIKLTEAATQDVFRLEALPVYKTAQESAGLRAYLAGEPRPVPQGSSWLDLIKEKVGRGVNWRKVHLCRSPLSEYERWEFEWSYPMTGKAGQQAFVLDLAEIVNPPALPNYDWWMYDELIVIRMHYDDAGKFIGGEQLSPADTSKHIAYRDTSLIAAVEFSQLQPTPFKGRRWLRAFCFQVNTPAYSGFTNQRKANIIKRRDYQQLVSDAFMVVVQCMDD